MAIVNIINICTMVGAAVSAIEYYKDKKRKAILAEAEAEGYEVIFYWD